MYMCVCMYVCMFVCVCVCMYVCMYVCLCVYVCVNVITTWGRSPHVVPKIKFSPHDLYLFIYLFVCHTYISSIHVVLEK